ncbi:MAG: hypothetical protein ACOX8S_01290 [Christensenellales bacterium]
MLRNISHYFAALIKIRRFRRAFAGSSVSIRALFAIVVLLSVFYDFVCDAVDPYPLVE